MAAKNRYDCRTVNADPASSAVAAMVDPATTKAASSNGCVTRPRGWNRRNSGNARAKIGARIP